MILICNVKSHDWFRRNKKNEKIQHEVFINSWALNTLISYNDYGTGVEEARWHMASLQWCFMPVRSHAPRIGCVNEKETIVKMTTITLVTLKRKTTCLAPDVIINKEIKIKVFVYYFQSFFVIRKYSTETALIYKACTF